MTIRSFGDFNKYFDLYFYVQLKFAITRPNECVNTI